MKRVVRSLVAVALTALAACSPSSSELGEVAAELRALRLQARSSPSLSADKTQVAEALTPLRTALDGLLAAQRDLQTQQVELAREMQRWSQLVGESASAARQEEGRALALRLQQLEQKMAQQETRHREVETLLRGALDRTSERLESFLLQLQSVPRAADATPGATSVPVAPPAAGATGTPPETSEKRGAMPGAAKRSGPFGALGWWILLVVSVVVSGNLFLRAIRGRSLAASPLRADGREPPTTGRHEGAAAAGTAPATESTEEIWAAAALLGEAVDRLRRGKEVAGTAPVSASAAGDLDLAGLDDRDLFVVEGLDEPAVVEPVVVSRDAEPPAPTPAVPAPRSEPSAGAAHAVAAILPRRAPAQLSFRLRPRDPAQACAVLLKLLREDPRVLLRPEPTVHGAGPELVCRFAVLPGLPAGECSVLEQRLRDGVA